MKVAEIRRRVGVVFALVVVTLLSSAMVPAQAGGFTQLIVFQTSRDGYEQIYRMTGDGSDQKSLSKDPTRDDYFPSWSPDGKRIIFVSYYDSKAHIVSMAQNGDDKTVLLETDGHIEQPSVSPDGKMLVYAAEEKEDSYIFQIYTAGIDGSNPTNLTKSKSNDKNPAWSPDGKQIVFTSSADSKFHLKVMNADGSKVKDISTAKNADFDHDPAWSPDGKHVAFTGTTPMFAFQVFVMNADGTKRVQLTEGEQSMTPTWTTDGKRIAYVTFPDGPDGQIFVMNADGTEPTNISNNKFNDSHPAWMPIPPEFLK